MRREALGEGEWVEGKDLRFKEGLRASRGAREAAERTEGKGKGAELKESREGAGVRFRYY
jgi:hypothetical protein